MTAHALSAFNAFSAINVKTRKFVDFRDHILNSKIKTYRPKVVFELEFGDYVVKTAQSPDELKELLKLRHQVFIQEWQGRSKILGVDFDRYDLNADHMLVKCKSTGQIIATYRLLCSEFVERFYTEDEFTIQNFLSVPGVKLELGRACVHRFFRNGIALTMIWKGLGEYAKRVNAKYLFGCASVQTADPSESLALFHYLRDHHSFEYGAHPTPDYQFDRFSHSPAQYSLDFLDKKIPSLLKSYLKAGAQIHSLPAIDYDFNCIDLFTILDLDKTNQRFKDRYF